MSLKADQCDHNRSERKTLDAASEAVDKQQAAMKV